MVCAAARKGRQVPRDALSSSGGRISGCVSKGGGRVRGQGIALFRTLDRHRQLTKTRMCREDAWKMIKRRARQVGLSEEMCNHTFRATGITAYMKNGGTLEKAQQMAAHSSSRTTSLYDRTSDEVEVEEVNRIQI